ncbi:MAG: threonine/serine exporter family protein [Thermoanaerobaculia bacterium]|nr:threonine/serine exporter family protein [Thermoanaerobaculia bacterium]
MSANPPTEGAAFAIKLMQALHRYGTPSHLLEEGMTELTRLLGLEGRFFSLPTGVFASIEKPGDPSSRHIEIIRVEQTELDLGRMSDVTAVGHDVLRRALTIREGSRRLDEILTAPPRYGAIVTTLAFAVTSGVAGRFFGAGLNEVSLALVTGLAVGLLSLLIPRSQGVARLYEVLAGLLVSLIAVVGASTIGGASIPIVTVAGLIVLVPGLTLTIAISEIAQRSLVSGTSRLLGAIIVFLMLGFGVAGGGQLGALIVGQVADRTPVPLPLWTEALAVLIATVSLTVLMRAPIRDLGAIMVASSFTYLAVRVVSPHVGPELGVCVGAMVAGALSNLHARGWNRPAGLTRLPAIMLLVPGGLGFTGIASLLREDIVHGMATAFSVALISIALVVGLILSNAIVPPRRAL